MRISDWSSDVCSSDLLKVAHHCLAVFDAPPLDYAAIDLAGAFARVEKVGRPIVARDEVIEAPRLDAAGARHDRLGANTMLARLIFLPEALGPRPVLAQLLHITKSERRRLGKECVNTGN